MPDENKNGIDDEIESVEYRTHAGRKFWLTVYVVAVFLVIASVLLFREVYEEMNDTLKAVIWLVGVYCGANVAQDFSNRRRHD